MNFIYDIMPEEFIKAIGWTIFHSLWQGAITSILLAGMLLLTRTSNSRLRYILSAAALFFMFGISIITFTQVYTSSTHVFSGLMDASIGTSNSIGTTNLTVQSVINSNPDLIETVTSYFAKQMPLIVTLWFFGFLVFSFRFVGGVVHVQNLRRDGIKTLDDFWIYRLRELSEKFGLNKLVQIFESSKVKVPATIGYIKPVILLPLGMISGLPQDQVEAIIIHELAHIKRYDFLINLFQAFIETLFFYHPVIWWISSTMKNERENRCDDLTLELCGGSLIYFKALYNLQQICSAETDFVLAAIGKKNQLFRRINRMNSNKKNTSYGFKFAAFAVLLTIIAAVSIYSTSSARDIPHNNSKGTFVNPINSFGEISSIASVTDTLSMKKGKHTLKFYDKENGEKKKFKAKLDNGKLEELSIDGDKVDAKDLSKYEGKVYQRLDDYEAGMEEYNKGIEKYKESMEEYRKSMKSYREKMKDFRVHRDSDFNAPDIDLSELKDLAKEIRENVRVHIPRIPKVHIPPIHIPPVHIRNWDDDDDFEFDNEEFREGMKEWKENFKKEMENWKVDMKDFKFDMEKFNKEMKNNGPGSEAFKKSMEDLKVNMGNLKVEMKKLKGFINDTKEELVKDKLMNDGDDLDDFTLSKDEMKVDGKKVSAELHRKYLELYKKHFGKELTGDKKFRINN